MHSVEVFAFGGGVTFGEGVTCVKVLHRGRRCIGEGVFIV